LVQLSQNNVSADDGLWIAEEFTKSMNADYQFTKQCFIDAAYDLQRFHNRSVDECTSRMDMITFGVGTPSILQILLPDDPRKEVYINYIEAVHLMKELTEAKKKVSADYQEWLREWRREVVSTRRHRDNLLDEVPFWAEVERKLAHHLTDLKRRMRSSEAEQQEALLELLHIRRELLQLANCL